MTTKANHYYYFGVVSTTALAVMIALVFGLFIISTATKPAHAATTFTVINDNDSGTGSLRQAILDANTTLGADVITFAISGGGVKTISPTSALPDITEAVTIDGYTQPGASQNSLSPGNNAVLKIELRGTSAGSGVPGVDGLTIKANNSTVKGLVINRWSGSGVAILGSGATGNEVQGNFIGTNATGTKDRGNSSMGVLISGAPNNTIGGTVAGARNVISGNDGHGVGIGNTNASGNQVQGNYIGTDKKGTKDLGNSFDGVSIEQAPNNTIGGTVAEKRNVISGNDANGVSIAGANATSNSVQSNYVGIKANGTQKLRNSLNGVHIQGAPNNTVGAVNRIVGNGQHGVSISQGAATGNQVQRNFIFSNGKVGVAIDGAATGNSIRANSIDANGLLGIDLGYDGVTPNDAGDPDTGDNNLQNYPVVEDVSSDAHTTQVGGTLNSTANTTFVIEFFSSPAADTSGFGEGKTYFEELSVTTDANGDASFFFSRSVVGGPAPVAPGQAVSATATSDTTGDTSEFSQAAVVNGGEV